MKDIYEVKDTQFIEKIKNETQTAISELCKQANLKKGDILVIGCSSSEILGEKIGTNSSVDVANAVFFSAYPILKEKGIIPAFQCCEHLNRAIITERCVCDKLGLTEVNVVPQPKAGGSLATLAYKNLENAVAVEKISADAGIDIGLTLIGMHLKQVAVPLRISIKKIGNAPIVCARTRPKFIGGSRAVYNDDLM